MLKLCYKNNDRRTDEYYFDLQSQKVYKICLSTYYAKQNTRGIPFAFHLRWDISNTFRAGISTCIITWKW